MIIDNQEIERLLSKTQCRDSAFIRDILAKAREAKGLTRDEVSDLITINDPLLLDELFDAARAVKEHIYGKRLVLFAPLYISNLCQNECVYCAFRSRNKEVTRRCLSKEEISNEVHELVKQGHKRVLLVAGELFPKAGLDYVLEAIDAVYTVRSGPGEIRRINVNIAPLTSEEFSRLRERHIGTYQLFQETYHRPTYEEVHIAGPKRNYEWRITCMDRALESGINDVGIGVLFGLYDWRYEVLAMLQHVEHLEKQYGLGPHTISVPRIEPATGSDFASAPPYHVSDVDFRKLVAIIRLAVPYTGMILSTRETAELRRSVFALGISQISAGSRTNPGGYMAGDKEAAAQFSLGDHRTLDEVIRDISRLGYIPSFCTACYRLGRTGKDFMDMARPGEIRSHCEPNAMTTFLEYLLDYASPETRQEGEQTIAGLLSQQGDVDRKRNFRLLEAIRAGKRDIFL